VIELTHRFEVDVIRYRGAAPALTDAVAGREQMITNAAAPFQPFPAAGSLPSIAIAGRQRASILPELSTSFAQGFPEIVGAIWCGLLAPEGTPAGPIAWLHAAMNATLEDSTGQARLIENGVEIETSPASADFRLYFAAERERWGAIVRRTNLRTE